MIIGVGITIYGLSYGAVRTSHSNPNGRIDFDTGSRVAHQIFTPAICLEKFARETRRSEKVKSFDEVLAESRSTNRPILIVLGAKSCLPCRQLERFLRDQEAILSKYFIYLKANIDDPLTPGELIRKTYRTLSDSNGYTNYLPWIAFVDGNGHLLLTGDDKSEGLIGIPHGGPQDRAWFLEMLHTANPKMTGAEIDRIDAAAEAYHKFLWRDIPPVPRRNH